MAALHKCTAPCGQVSEPLPGGVLFASEPHMPSCSRCGESADPSDKFCSRCGTLMSVPDDAAMKEHKGDGIGSSDPESASAAADSPGPTLSGPDEIVMPRPNGRRRRLTPAKLVGVVFITALVLMSVVA